MIVFYSQPNVLVANVSSPESEFRFLPGNNNVPAEVWKDLMANPNFARRVNSGSLKIKSDVEQDEEDDSSSALSDLGPADAKQMVRETYDPELLRRWRAAETRKTVVAVIDEQLQAPDVRMAQRKKEMARNQRDEEDEE